MFNLIKSNYTIRTEAFHVVTPPLFVFHISSTSPSIPLPLNSTSFRPNPVTSNQLNHPIGQVCIRFSVLIGPLFLITGGVAVRNVFMVGGVIGVRGGGDWQILCTMYKRREWKERWCEVVM